MSTFLQTLMDAVAVGSLYALIALGYTLVFGILQFINFAHGDVFALGAWLTCVAAIALIHLGHAHPFFSGEIALGILVPLAAIIGCGVVGFLIQQFAYKPLRFAPRLNVLITAIGVSLLLENTGQLRGVFGPYPRKVPTIFADRVLAQFAGVQLRLVDVVVFSVAVGLMLIMQYWIYHTRFGRAMRAVSFNLNIAALMGVNIDRVIALTFFIGSALAGAAGFLYAMKYPQLQQTAASTWILLGLKA
ncbi:MAG TPA: branched-chain amino acid ABC transporter permease, partial [Tepidisphaeraceae bacterium]|nr:branched-chain amino acid ABC transporter permease [Tepidisphaeraceae bacterium]